MPEIIKTDVLAFGAHPDDVELSCGGTIASLCAAGKTVGIIDLTRGELGTRGSEEIRISEARDAADILGVKIRENLSLRDCFFKDDESAWFEVIKIIRKYRPDIILTNAKDDRHPDHGKAANLVKNAAFLSGLRKITTSEHGKIQEPWRPRKVFYSIQDRLMMPHFVIDITPHFESKMNAIKAFKTQFFNPQSTEPKTYISSPHFLPFLEARAREMGHLIGAEFGEGFLSDTPVGL